MNDPDMSLSRLNQLHGSLGLHLKKLRKEWSLMTGNAYIEKDKYGSNPDSESAIAAILDVRRSILAVEASITSFNIQRHEGLVIASKKWPIMTVAEIAAEFGLNGYIKEHAEELADKTALYRVSHKTEEEGGQLISHSIIRDRIPYDRAMELGSSLALSLGLKESLLHGQWITCMPCEIEEYVVVEKV